MNKKLQESSRTASLHAKTDIDVVWKYVHYPRSRETVIQTMKEYNRLIRERTTSGKGSLSKKFAYLKSSKDRSSKKGTKDVSEDIIESDDEVTNGKSSFSQSSKDKGKSIEQSKRNTIIQRASSVISNVDSIRISISNLTFLFQQNKPQMFFGIRKPKTFEHITEKDTKQEILKPYPSIESMFDLFVKPLRESIAKESYMRQPSQLQTLSLRFTSINATEIMDRFTNLTKASEKKSVNKEILDVLKEIAKEALINKDRMMRIAGFRHVSFPDINDGLTRERILFLYVNNHYRENHPHYKDKIKDEVEESEFEKEIMKNCVLNNKLILRVMKNVKFYPFQLRLKMMEIDSKLSSTTDESNEKRLQFATKLKFEPKIKKPKSSLIKKNLNALDEICSDCKEFNGFYRPLFEYWTGELMNSGEFFGDIDSENIKNLVQDLSVIISSKRNQPGTKIMILTQQIIKCGLTNISLLNELCNNVEGWLDQILKSLLSKFSSVRLECFITICYLLSKQNYVTGLYSNLFNETFYDIVATILRCIDLKSEEFPLYYSLLGVIFHFAPSQIILDCLIERGPYSTEVEMISRWPKFVYIAIRYWPSQCFNASPIFLRRIVETLENHYLRESLSRKCLKEAICCIVKRFNVTSNMITVWPKITESFPE